jgi:hypothetical protein
VAFISTKSKTRQKWLLDSVALTDAYTDFLLSRQASRCTTIAFYNFTAGKFLEYLKTQITSLSEVGAGHFRAYLADLVKGPLLVMNDWLAVRGPQLGGLFHPVNIGGKLIASRMTAQALYKMLIKRGAEVKVQDFSPHDMQRSFITDLLPAGADIATAGRKKPNKRPLPSCICLTRRSKLANGRERK